MKIITVTKTAAKGGFLANVHGKTPPIQAFAKTEIEALMALVEKLQKRNPKHIQ